MVKERQISWTLIPALAALALASCLNPQSRLGGDGGTADAGPGDACPAVSCGDAQVCLRGACTDRITEFPMPPNRHPGINQVIAGPGGLVWFLAQSKEIIGNITSEGVVTEYQAPPDTGLDVITVGSDGNIWYRDMYHNAVGSMTPTGVYSTSFSLSASGITIGALSPVSLTSDPDGNLWLNTDGPNIVRITAAGAVTPFPLPTPDANPFGFIAGPDGNVWFCESIAQVGQVTPQGVITEFPLLAGDGYIGALASGPDGNLWMAVEAPYGIERMTPQGVITAFPFPPLTDRARDLTFGADGNIWFSEDAYDRSGIGRMTPTGEVIELLLPNPGFSVYGVNTIAAGADGNIWFSELYGDKIGRVIPF